MQAKVCLWDAKALVSFLLRTGLAVTFLYAAIASFIEPVAWIGFLPEWTRNLVPETLLLFGFSLYEMFLAFWLLSNKKPFEAAVLSSFTLLLIVLANITVLYIVFRDVAILFASLALVVLNFNKKNKTKKQTKREKTK